MDGMDLKEEIIDALKMLEGLKRRLHELLKKI